MDVINFWKAQVAKWNEDQLCGGCWTFNAPLTDAAVNTSQSPTDKECCYHVFLTNYRETNQNQYSTVTYFQNGQATTFNFDLNIVKQGDIGQNNYNEMPEYPISEGKWESLLQPLRECITAKDVMAFCLILGYRVQIPNWNLTPVLNWQDMNYDGWRITMTFRLTE